MMRGTAHQNNTAYPVISQRYTRTDTNQADRPVCNVSSGQKWESGERKWGTGHRVRKAEGKRWVLSAPLPLLAQEDP
eukprot:6936721-Pyramimonas_sp.AAC.1